MVVPHRCFASAMGALSSSATSESSTVLPGRPERMAFAPSTLLCRRRLSGATPHGAPLCTVACTSPIITLIMRMMATLMILGARLTRPMMPLRPAETAACEHRGQRRANEVRKRGRRKLGGEE